MGLFALFQKPSAGESFQRDGFLFLPRFFTSERIDAARAAVNRLLVERPFDVVVDNLATNQRTFWAQAATPETRQFKFNDLFLTCPEIRSIALDPRLTKILRELLGQPAVLCNSLNFEKGSGQPKHIDSLFMTPRTPHHLIATWVAFEDVHPDAGPLLYYPGSHRVPLYTFKDGSHHATPEELPAWNAYIEAQMRERGFQEKVFKAKKGDLFIWHSDLLHAGGPIKDHKRTRNSLVCHYYSEPDARAQGLELQPEHDGFWWRRLPQSVRVDPQVFRDGAPFPEERYLARYPDIKTAVETGGLASGLTHYVHLGYAEGRGV